ncbi:MAG: mannitol-1-phosphate 5-dehydrogenase [Acidimicrobiia bacterium]|nr:mannitol-1-phosphate 5-dehydrogenase [Acidimicrobiia bacterium]
MTRRRVAVFGAGNIGRGLLGWLFGRAGWEVVFLDVSAPLVDLLNREGEYRVIEVGNHSRSTRLIRGVRGVNSADVDRAAEEASQAELLCTAVGVAILDRVAPVVAAALSRNDSRIRNVLACENADPNSGALRQHVERLLGESTPGVGFPETLVDRMVPGGSEDDLSVEVEARFDFKVSREEWVGEDPGIEGFTLVDNLALHRKRKLWLVNGLHAAAAFIGLRKGHETVAEAVSDPTIRERLDEITETMAAALSAQSPEWRRDELAGYGRYNLERFETTTLVDPIRRVARNPLAKLGPTERLVGPAREAARRGLAVDALCEAIAAGLSVNDPEVPGSEELRDALSGSGWRSVVGLGAEDRPLLEMLENRLASPV